MSSFKTSWKRGQAVNAIQIVGSTEVQADTISLNIDSTKMSKGDALLGLTKIKQRLFNSPFPPVAGDTTPTPTPTAKVGQIGFNLTEDGFDNSLFAPNFFFINRMKASGYDGAWNNGATLSQYGYPTTAGTGGRDTATFLPVRRPAAGQPPIRHVLRHNGTNVDFAIVFLTGLSIVDDTDPNRIVFDVPYTNKADENPALVVRSATVWPDYRPGNPANSANPTTQRDGWACMELSLEASWLAGEIYHPRAIDELKDFSLGRTMDVQRINNSPVQTLAHRTHVGRCSYGSASTPYGWPLEVMVALFNKTKVMPWLCMPHDADNDYQDWFWTYVRDNLDPTIPIVAEYSNEAGWNTDFGGQYNRCVQAGKALDNSYGGSQGYGWLAARMMARAKAVFGAQSGRLHGAFVRQRGNITSFTEGLVGVRAAGYELRDVFRIGSQGGYLDGGFEFSSNGPSSAENRQKVRDIYAGYAATGADDASRTFSPAFANQMRHGTGLGLPNMATLDQLQNDDLALEAFCRAQNLQHNMKYELQNFHASMIGLGAIDGGNANGMLSRLANDPQISGIGAGSLMREQYDFFRDHGISGCCVLTPYGAINMYGSWATKRDPFAANTNLWNFYKNEQTNAKLIVLDLWMEGTTNVTAGQAFERQIKSYGGVFPAGQITIKAGALPGVTLAGGKLSGQLAAGEYPVVFAITDATGREVTLSVTFTAAAQTGYRYFRFTPKKAGSGFYSPTPDEGGYRIGCREIRAKRPNGTLLDTSTWTATSLSSSGDHPPSALVDGSITADFLTDGGLQPKPGVIILDSGSGAGVKPASFDIGDSVTDESYQIDGVVIEASKDGAAYVKIGETGAARGYSAFPNEPQGPRMTYTDHFCTVPVAYP